MKKILLSSIFLLGIGVMAMAQDKGAKASQDVKAKKAELAKVKAAEQTVTPNGAKPKNKQNQAAAMSLAEYKSSKGSN